MLSIVNTLWVHFVVKAFIIAFYSKHFIPFFVQVDNFIHSLISI